jgi:hypothetical protein
VIARALLLLGLVAAGAHCVWVWAFGHGTVDDRIALVLALKLVCSFAVAARFVWTSERPVSPALVRVSDLCNRRPGLVVALLVVGSAAITFATTPRVGFGEGPAGVGYGHDGMHYGWMAEHFGWFEHEVSAPFAYRFVAPMLVHYSGLGTFGGFRVLNLGCHALGTWLIYRIARRFTRTPAAAVLAAAFFVTRKFGLKFLTYYPVATDGLGDVVMLAIIWATLERRHAAYVLAMIVAVGTRENLLALLPFNALHVVRTGAGRRRFVLAATLQLVPLVLLALSRWHPVFRPVGAPGPTLFLTAGVALAKSPATQGVLSLAYSNALGALAVLPLLSWRRTVAFLGERWEWAYFLVSTFVLSAVGGYDYDRFASWMTPLPLVLLVAAELRDAAVPSRLWLHLLALQAVAMELFLPWYPDEPFYLSRYAAHAFGAGVAAIAVYAWVLVVLLVAMRLSGPDGRRSGVSPAA